MCTPGNIQLINTDTVHAGWGNRIAIIESNGSNICLSLGTINTNRTLRF
jgi:hypothetical protein